LEFFLLFLYVQTDGSRLASDCCLISGRIFQAQAGYGSMLRHARNSVNTRDIVHFGEPRISTLTWRLFSDFSISLSCRTYLETLCYRNQCE